MKTLKVLEKPDWLVFLTSLDHPQTESISLSVECATPDELEAAEKDLRDHVEGKPFMLKWYVRQECSLYRVSATVIRIKDGSDPQN